MSTNKINLLLWTVAIILGGGVIIYLIWMIDWSLLTQLTIFEHAILLFSTLLLIGLHALGAVALLWGLNYRAKVSSVLSAIFAASAVGLVGDPKLGVPARLAYYKLLMNVPIRAGTAATIIESLIWLLLMGIIVAIPGTMTQDYSTVLSIFALIIVVCVIALIILGPEAVDRLWLVGSILRKIKPVRNFIFDVRTAILSIKAGWLFVAFGWLTLTYLVDVWSVWFLAKGVGSDLEPIDIGHAIVISYLAGAASLVPLGLGVRDIAFAKLLENAGSTHEISALIVLYHRTLRTVVPLLLGFVISLFIARRKSS